MTEWQHETDLLVVGSGGGGMTAFPTRRRKRSSTCATRSATVFEPPAGIALTAPEYRRLAMCLSDPRGFVVLARIVARFVGRAPSPVALDTPRVAA